MGKKAERAKANGKKQGKAAQAPANPGFSARRRAVHFLFLHCFLHEYNLPKFPP